MMMFKASVCAFSVVVCSEIDPKTYGACAGSSQSLRPKKTIRGVRPYGFCQRHNVQAVYYLIKREADLYLSYELMFC